MVASTDRLREVDGREWPDFQDGSDCPYPYVFTDDDGLRWDVVRHRGEWKKTKSQTPLRAGTIDEAPAMAMNQKAAVVANAAAAVRVSLDAEQGRKGDLQTLSRLVNVPAPALAKLYDEIVDHAK